MKLQHLIDQLRTMVQLGRVRDDADVRLQIGSQPGACTASLDEIKLDLTRGDHGHLILEGNGP